ncbi:hypothetical protein CsSME_00032225 [Camellia sinensis var. sinensis]
MGVIYAITTAMAHYELQIDPTVGEVKRKCNMCRFNANSDRLQECNLSGPSSSSMTDCILLASCEAHESLPQHAGLPADVFTSCLTTPIKMALSWYVPFP